jgi:UDP-glucuronate 4-epimerase
MQNAVLITGGAGFIGSNLVDSLLGKNINVIALDNFDSFYSEDIKHKNIKKALTYENFKFFRVDICNKQELKNIFEENNIQMVVHLAAKAGVRPSIENPQDYYQVNVQGTLNILEMMREFSVKKLVFASSSSVYGNNKKIPFSEIDSVDNPISPYAASKKAGELLCHTYHHLYGFDVFCLRFFTVYGPRQRPDLAIHKFSDFIIQGLPIPIYGDGSTARDYTYIDDVVQAICSSIEKVNGYEIINIGESKLISLNLMIQTLEENLDTKAIREYLPCQPGDVDVTWADISKAKNIIGYHPQWEFNNGISEFVKWKKK